MCDDTTTMTDTPNGYSIPLLGDAVRFIKDLGFPIAIVAVLMYGAYSFIRTALDNQKIVADQLSYMSEADKRREKLLEELIATQHNILEHLTRGAK